MGQILSALFRHYLGRLWQWRDSNLTTSYYSTRGASSNYCTTTTGHKSDCIYLKWVAKKLISSSLILANMVFACEILCKAPQKNYDSEAAQICIWIMRIISYVSQQSEMLILLKSNLKIKLSTITPEQKTTLFRQNDFSLVKSTTN